MLNEVHAFRHRGIPMQHDRMTTYALAVPMISQSLIEGVHKARDVMANESEDEQDESEMQYDESSEDDHQAALKQHNSTRDYPLLHRVILRMFTRKITDRTTIIKDIFARFPSVVDFEDEDGNTPVHLVLFCRIDPSVLYAFKAATDTDVWNKILQHANRAKQTPISIALQHHTIHTVIRDLVDTREKVLIETNGDMHTPIQNLIYNMTNDTALVIFDMLKSKHDGLHPSEALLNQDACGNTALHLLLLAANSDVCTMSRMQPLIAQLIDDYQEVLCMTNYHYSYLPSEYDSDVSYMYEADTPLHMALKMAMPLAVIDQLTDTGGKVWTVKNHLADTPLHTALRRNTQPCQHGEHGSGFVATNVVLHIMQTVFKKHSRDFFRHYDKHGDTVLHFAIKNNAKSRILEKLVEMEPWALGIRNDIQHNTPLHLALQYRRDTVLVEKMVHADSSVLHNINIDGDTPLHLAIKKKASRNMVSILAIADPNVLCVKNNIFFADKQERRAADTPLSLAIKGTYGLDVVRLLIDHNKAVLTCLDVHGETPVHAALQKKMYAHVKFMFETVGGEPCSMCMDLDRRGRTPLNYMLETGNGDMQLIHLLLQENEDVMMCANSKKMTPLHTALSMNMPRKIIEMLLPKNTDKLYALLMAKNDNLHTPFDIAKIAKGYSRKFVKLLTPMCF